MRNETQLELAKALKVVCPIYATTRDRKLERLLKEAEHYFHQGQPFGITTLDNDK